VNPSVALELAESEVRKVHIFWRWLVYDHPLFTLVAQLAPGLNLTQGFDTPEEASEMARDLRDYCMQYGLNREVSVAAGGFTVLVKSTASPGE
jgi:hypothetical protein